LGVERLRFNGLPVVKSEEFETRRPDWACVCGGCASARVVDAKRAAVQHPIGTSALALIHHERGRLDHRPRRDMAAIAEARHAPLEAWKIKQRKH
jgi:hypothetical protein